MQPILEASASLKSLRILTLSGIEISVEEAKCLKDLVSTRDLPLLCLQLSRNSICAPGYAFAPNARKTFSGGDISLREHAPNSEFELSVTQAARNHSRAGNVNKHENGSNRQEPALRKARQRPLFSRFSRNKPVANEPSAGLQSIGAGGSTYPGSCGMQPNLDLVLPFDPSARLLPVGGSRSGLHPQGCRPLKERESCQNPFQSYLHTVHLRCVNLAHVCRPQKYKEIDVA